MHDGLEGAKPDIFKYTNYRDYLQDFYRAKKARLGGYSFRMFARRAGFASPNLLKLVIEGQRNITTKSIEKFIQGLGLTGDSRDYFIAMVNMNNANSPSEQGFYQRMMQKFIPTNQTTLLQDESFQYLSHWIHAVLDELVTHREFDPDPQWIQDKLWGSASLFDISSAMDFLGRQGFIGKDDGGRYLSHNKLLTTPANAKSLAIRRYHRIIMQQASEMLDILPSEERDYRALTLSIPREQVEALRSKIKSFREELLDWYLTMNSAGSREENVVMQLNFQVYPQTK